MKKVIKSISVLVLSLSLVLSGFVFTGNVKADATDTWKANAVKTPKADSLVGAGYITVEFDNSLSGYTYEVLLDGKSSFWKDGNILRSALGEDESTGSIKTFTSSDAPKTEVYTTDVAAHQITVKATKPNNPTLTSDPVTFYVSKKGMAMGDDMGTKMQLKKLNCSWYYNWNSYGFHNSIDQDVAHMPMIWGGPEEEIQTQVADLENDSNYVLGFNEPDIEGQANMNFFDAVPLWKKYVSPIKMRKVSPAPAAPGSYSKWLDSFMNGDTICYPEGEDGGWDYYYMYEGDPNIQPINIEGANDFDSIALHSYSSSIDAKSLINAVKGRWNRFHKPIWVTEIGLFGIKGNADDKSYENAEKRAEIQSFMTTVVNALDELPYVERYCWFAYDVESVNAIDSFDGSGATAMFEYTTGLYTELGKAYSNIANPSGYNAYSISNAEMFNWNNRAKYEVSYNQSADSAKVSWTKGALSSMPKVEVSIDDVPYNVQNGGQIKVSELDEGKHVVKFTVYEDDKTTVMVTKTRALNIERKEVPTTKAPTKATVKPAVKPGNTTIKGKNLKKKSAKLSWGAVSGAKQYKLNWAMNKKFTKKNKTKIVTKTSYKVTKLKKKKTYYFRVAAMNDAGIGPWSNIKKIKIKK